MINTDGYRWVLGCIYVATGTGNNSLRGSGNNERSAREQAGSGTAAQTANSRGGSEPARSSMKIYFCGSIRGGRSDQLLYRRIVNALSRYGSVLTEHVACAELSDSGERGPAGGDRAIHDRDLAWLQQSDVVVAEVTQPSLGVGYELGRALDMEDKKVLCLFRPSSGRALSAMIRGAADGRRFLVVDYSEEQLEGVLDRFFRSRLNAKQQVTETN